MKFTETEGSIEKVATAEECRSSAEDTKSAFDTLAAIDQADIESFIFLVKVRPGSIEQSPESDCIAMRAGNLADLAQMASNVHNQTSRDLMEHQLRNLFTRAEERNEHNR